MQVTPAAVLLRLSSAGICCVYSEDPLDVKSAYPYGQIIANISRETTILELCEIVGVEDIDRRIIGLNLTAGHTNSVEFMTRAFKAPQMKTLLDSFLQDFPNE